jgi:hypothetical protein
MYQNAWRHMPEHCNLISYHHENLISQEWLAENKSLEVFISPSKSDTALKIQLKLLPI